MRGKSCGKILVDRSGCYSSYVYISGGCVGDGSS